MSTFEKAVTEAAQRAVLKAMTDGSWIATDYSTRFKIPPEVITQAYEMINKDQLKAQLARRLEAELADRIVNHIAAELATDIKQILSVQERREMLRNIARENLDAIMRAGQPK